MRWEGTAHDPKRIADIVVPGASLPEQAGHTGEDIEEYAEDTREVGVD